MEEAIKQMLFDFKKAGWTVQGVEKELNFSNGTLGKVAKGKANLSMYRLAVLTDFYNSVIGMENSKKILKKEETNKSTTPKPNKEEKEDSDMPEELVNQIIAIQTQPKPSFVPLKNFKSYKQKQIDELMKNYKKQ